MEKKSINEYQQENLELKQELHRMKAAYEEEKTSKDQLLFILKQNNVLLFTGELDGVGANWGSDDNYFKNILGVSISDKPELKYTNLIRFIHQNDKALIKKQIKHFKKAKTKNFDGIFRLFNNKADIIWFYSTVTPFENNDILDQTRCTGILKTFGTNYKVIKQLSEYYTELKQSKLKKLNIQFSKTQKQLVKLIAQGFTSDYIAKQLLKSESEIDRLKSSLFKITKTPNAPALVHWFNLHGLL